MSNFFVPLDLAFKYYKQWGFIALLNKIFSKFQGGNSMSLVDIEQSYSYINRSEFGQAWVTGLASEKSINWIIPNFNIGSGGHLNIFRFISYLEKSGYEVTIILDEERLKLDADRLKDIICRHFVQLEARIIIGVNNMPPAYSTFATSWNTAYAVKAYVATKNKFYFVQDFEPFFYAVGTDYSLAERTYGFGFYGITAGNWLKNKLASDYKMLTKSVSFSYDKHSYKPIIKEKVSGQKKRVFFYARPPTQRRAFELGILTLMKAYSKNSDFEVVFAGWDLSAYKFDFDYESHGVVSLDKLPDLYQSCDLALVLSFTNLSLLPLELMACGVPVISNKGENVQWLLNEENSILCESSTDDLASGILNLLENDELRQVLSKNSIEFARKTSWDREGEIFVNCYEDFIKGDFVEL